MDIQELYKLAENTSRARTAHFLSMLSALVASLTILVSTIAKNCMH